MSAAAALLLASFTLPVSGWCYHYHFGMMAAVAHTRALRLDPTVDGYASTPRCDWIGGYLSAYLDHRPVILQVIDCSNPADLPHQLRPRSAGGLGLVLEVDWGLAYKQGWATYHGATGPGRAPATVYSWWRGEPGVQTLTMTAVTPRNTRARALADAHARRDGNR